MSSTGYNTFVCHSGSISTTASTAKTVLLVATISTQDIMLTGYRVTMDTTTGPVCLVEILRATALGTSSGTPTAYKKNNVDGRAANGLPKSTFSVEPTYGDVVEQFWLTPNQPTWSYDYVFGDFPTIAAGAANGIAIRVTPGASSTPNVRGTICWAE